MRHLVCAHPVSVDVDVPYDHTRGGHRFKAKIISRLLQSGTTVFLRHTVRPWERHCSVLSRHPEQRTSSSLFPLAHWLCTTTRGFSELLLPPKKVVETPTNRIVANLQTKHSILSISIKKIQHQQDARHFFHRCTRPPRIQHSLCSLPNSQVVEQQTLCYYY